MHFISSLTIISIMIVSQVNCYSLGCTGVSSYKFTYAGSLHSTITDVFSINEMLIIYIPGVSNLFVLNIPPAHQILGFAALTVHRTVDDLRCAGKLQQLLTAHRAKQPAVFISCKILRQWFGFWHMLHFLNYPLWFFLLWLLPWFYFIGFA